MAELRVVPNYVTLSITEGANTTEVSVPRSLQLDVSDTTAPVLVVNPAGVAESIVVSLVPDQVEIRTHAPQGAQGEQGPQGPQGIQGPVGPGVDPHESKTFVYTNGRVTGVNGTDVQKTISYNVDGTINQVIKNYFGTVTTKTFSYDINKRITGITAT